MIGDDECVAKSLTHTEVSCEPPRRRPKANDTSWCRDNTLPTDVCIHVALGGYVLKNFRDTASDIMRRYATPCRPVTECKMNDLE